MEKARFAAIDLGTNSCKITITDENGNPVYRNATSVMLGENLQKTKKISLEAKERTLNCLFDYKQKLDMNNVVAMRAIATAAMRKAKNGEDFLKDIYNETRINFEIIDEKEEARLSLKGAMSHVKGQSKYVLVYDIGGGSTEISLAHNNSKADTIYSISIPWGTRNSSDEFKLNEYDPEIAEKLKEKILFYIKRFIKNSEYEKYKDQTKAIATSSIPLRLVSMIKGFEYYDRNQSDGLNATIEDINKKIEEILKMTEEERDASPYIGKYRGPIFISACIIFKTIYDALELIGLTASLRAAQEAIIEELTQEWSNKQS